MIPICLLFPTGGPNITTATRGTEPRRKAQILFRSVQRRTILPLSYSNQPRTNIWPRRYDKPIAVNDRNLRNDLRGLKFHPRSLTCATFDAMDERILYGALFLAGAYVFLSPRRLPGMTGMLRLSSQAFPESPHPGVLVHIPEGYDPSKPLDLVVYFRGFNSCVSVIAGAEQARCRQNGAQHKHSDLIGQLDRSGVNAILIVPELRVEESTGDPGQLGASGGFRRLLQDILEQSIFPALGGVRPVRRILLCAHSGGYSATAAAVSRGGVGNVDTVCLMDAFYGESSVFTSFAARAATQPVRFVSLYTDGTTESNSLRLASSLRGLGSKLLVDTSSRTPTLAQWNTPVFIKHVPDEHSWIPLHYFGDFLRTAGLEGRQ